MEGLKSLKEHLVAALRIDNRKTRPRKRGRPVVRPSWGIEGGESWFFLFSELSPVLRLWLSIRTNHDFMYPQSHQSLPHVRGIGHPVPVSEKAAFAVLAFCQVGLHCCSRWSFSFRTKSTFFK